MLFISTSTLGGLAIKPPVLEDPKTKTILQASKLEYKIVNEVYVFTVVHV